MKQFNVTELDFDKIKDAIKAYYKRTDSPFKDFDFEGSGLNLILDVLAYNTHYNAILAHLAANESFIASAQLRKNVVARAKTLGYIPRSVTASTTEITLTNLDASIVSIPAGTIFTTSDTLNGVSYSFINTTEISEPTQPFNVYQGSLKTKTFVFDSKDENARFEIPDSNVDISQLTVTSFLNSNSTQKETYTRFSELSDLTGESLVYFINENPNGKYEISFGDNILGKKPTASAIIQVQYLVTDGSSANSLSVFTTSDPLFDGVVKPTITATSATSGGGDKESIESIRANAPLNYLSQNRAVTVDDYVSLVRNNANVSAVSVWGGENNVPPEYGKVFISAKPQNGTTLSNAEKDKLLPILDKKGVLTIRPKFVDPDYTYLYFEIYNKYNSSLTNLGGAGISSLVRSGLSAFNAAYLSDFEGVFRYSEFLAYLVNLDPALLSSFARVKAYKTFSAVTTNTGDYTINFNFELAPPKDPTESLLSSTGFLRSGVTEYFADEPSTVDGIRNIYRYKVDVNTSLNIMTARNVGTVNYNTGLITINDFDIDSDTDIDLLVRPASNDIAPVRNQIIEIDTNKYTSITSDVDSIATGGSSGAIGYTTTTREEY